VTRPDFDLVVAGGGMVGAALAALLSGSGLRLALAEPRPARRPRPGEPLDRRVSALSRASEALLRELGAWDRLAHPPCAFERMVVWSGEAPALRLDAARVGEANLGHIVENLSIASALLEIAREQGVEFLGAPLRELSPGGDLVRFDAGGRSLSARLVVAADGASSPLRESAGITLRGAPYPQRAIVTHLVPEQAHGATARQRFLPGGPLALLPLRDGRVSLVWTLPTGEAERLLALGESAFERELTAASGGVLGALSLGAARASFPLGCFHAETYCRPRLALVGDAAHTLHPLAGQGVNLGFLDARALAGQLLAARAAGEDIGDLRVLGRYARARRADNALMLFACDGLNRLFAGEARIAAFGLGLVDRLPIVKASLVAHALGMARAAQA
jgi:2-polyprenylphenol 6-hydroxylase